MKIVYNGRVANKVKRKNYRNKCAEKCTFIYEKYLKYFAFLMKIIG